MFNPLIFKLKKNHNRQFFADFPTRTSLQIQHFVSMISCIIVGRQVPSEINLRDKDYWVNVLPIWMSIANGRATIINHLYYLCIKLDRHTNIYVKIV